MTAESQAEQAAAGLDSLDEAQRTRFLDLNGRYKARFGFPFVMAVRGRGAEEILAALDERIGNEPDVERARAIAEIETIALLRLRQRLPALPDVTGAPERPDGAPPDQAPRSPRAVSTSFARR